MEDVRLNNALQQSYISFFSHRGSYSQNMFYGKTILATILWLTGIANSFCFPTHWRSGAREKIGKISSRREASKPKRLILLFSAISVENQKKLGSSQNEGYRGIDVI